MSTPLEGLTKAFGAALGEIGGMRSTRLLLPLTVGDTVATVESTLDWPAAGKVIIGTQEYNYTSINPTSIVGLSYNKEGTLTGGAAAPYEAGLQVLDWTKTYSALDRLRLSFFVNSAVGKDLATIGRNLGVPRHPSVDDEVYRELIKAIAYTPKGTIYAIERLLTALYGETGWTIWEDLKTTSNTVFVNVGDANALLTEAQGNTYLGRTDPLLYDDVANTITLPFDPLGKVQGLKLVPEDFGENLAAAKLSDFTEVRYDGDVGQDIWTYAGANEVTAVTIVSTRDGGNLFDNSTGDLPSYIRTVRIQPESRAIFSARFAIDTDPIDAAKGSQWVMEMADTAVKCHVGVFDNAGTFQLGFVTAGGVLLGGTVLSNNLQFVDTHEVEICKDGSTWILSVDGVPVDTVDSSVLLAAPGNHNIRVGCRDATVPINARLDDVYFHIETGTNYGSIRGIGADVDTGSPTVLDTNSALVDVLDVGKGVRTYDSAVNNAFGGNNGGQWTVEAVVDADNVTLTGPIKLGAFVETTSPNQITSQEDRAFSFPQVLGHTVELLDVGPNQGAWTIAHVLDNVTGYPLQLQSSDYGDRILVVGAATGTSGVNGAVLTANSNRFVDSTASAFVPGDVNRFLYIPNSTALVNAGVFRVTAYISADEVEVDNVDQGQPFEDDSSLVWSLHGASSFTTETNMSWRIKPQFVTEAGLSWALSDALDLTTDTITLRVDPPGFTYGAFELILDTTFTTVLSAHLLPDEFEVNSKTADGPPKEFSNWPFYMPVDILGALREYLDLLTAAGVIPEISEVTP